MAGWIDTVRGSRPVPPRRNPNFERATVGNEFASIEVSIDTSGPSRRVVLTDVTSGQSRHIDPLVLEALVYMPDDVMQSLADPNLIVPPDHE